jgi:hypothetical protein
VIHEVSPCGPLARALQPSVSHPYHRMIGSIASAPTGSPTTRPPRTRQPRATDSVTRRSRPTSPWSRRPGHRLPIYMPIRCVAKARVGMTASDSTAKMIPTGNVSGSSRLMSDFTASQVM